MGSYDQGWAEGAIEEVQEGIAHQSHKCLQGLGVQGCGGQGGKLLVGESRRRRKAGDAAYGELLSKMNLC